MDVSADLFQFCSSSPSRDDDNSDKDDDIGVGEGSVIKALKRTVLRTTLFPHYYAMMRTSPLVFDTCDIGERNEGKIGRRPFRIVRP